MFDGRLPQVQGDGATARPMAAGWAAEYAFLLPLVGADGLLEAFAAADQGGILPHQHLVACGRLSPAAYCAALKTAAPHLNPSPPGAPTCTIDVTNLPPTTVHRHWAGPLARGEQPLLIELWGQALLERPATRAARVDAAAHRLQHTSPQDSATQRAALWQILVPFALAGLTLGASAFATEAALALLTALLAIPFLAVAVFRLVALLPALFGPTRDDVAAHASDADLPVYTVLVPLYREAEVLPDCIAALLALDYPRAKLDVIVLLEEDDTETLAAAASLDLPGCIRLVKVPALAPRTKPKALNYGLALARGEFVVVYDAEDVPEPDQLRKALAMFDRAGADLVCVQARLNLHRLPVPLGGTSNHFPRKVLDDALGWDPFNVTEDADLGLRLSRKGGRIGILDSTTWEEAPTTFRQWLPQRTRWLKGWMITLLVHTRDPLRLRTELGTWRTFGLIALIGGMLLSSLVHLGFYALILGQWFARDLWQLPETTLGRSLLALAAFNLAAGYGSAIALGMIATSRRHGPGLALHALLMPLYWMLISLAALRAAWQLWRQPYLWEKTRHHARHPRWSPPLGSRAKS